MSLLRFFSLTTLLLVVSSCDSGSGVGCEPPPSSVAPGTFEFRFEEAEGCFSLRGQSARFGVRPSSFTDEETVYALFVPDDGDEPTESTTFVEFLLEGDGPLPVGTYDVADLYVPSTVPLAPPAGDVRLIEYPGEIALQAVIGGDEVAFSRGGTVTVTRSGADGFAGRIDAEIAVQETETGRDEPGATLRVEGAFDVEPGADPFIIVF